MRTAEQIEEARHRYLDDLKREFPKVHDAFWAFVDREGIASHPDETFPERQWDADEILEVLWVSRRMIRVPTPVHMGRYSYATVELARSIRVAAAAA